VFLATSDLAALSHFNFSEELQLYMKVIREKSLLLPATLPLPLG
jgi:hypothetical protein